MKKVLKKLPLVVFASFAALTVTFADTEADSVYAKVMQAKASNDAQRVVTVLPEIENLWPQQPEIYFKSVRSAVEVLAASSNNAGSKSPLLTLWTNMLRKPLPADEEKAAACLELKRKTICVYLNSDEFSGDKSRWVDIAKFIGEIRSRIIPNYANQGMVISAAPDPAQQMQLQEALVENEKKKITDRLQQELRSADFEFSSYLIHNAPNSARKNAKFIEEVSTAAHLTTQEVDRLKRGSD